MMLMSDIYKKSAQSVFNDESLSEEEKRPIIKVLTDKYSVHLMREYESDIFSDWRRLKKLECEFWHKNGGHIND